jgi:hypothetical protein
MTHRGIRLLVPVASTLLGILPPSLSAQTLAGRLLDASRESPIALGRVTLVDLEGLPVVFTVADTDGSFVLMGPEEGDYWVTAQSLFYWEYSDGPITLLEADTVLVEFRLVPNPTELDELVVEAERRP